MPGRARSSLIADHPSRTRAAARPFLLATLVNAEVSGPADEIRCTLRARRTAAHQRAALPTWRYCP
jgi:hypothetical protein